MAAVSDETPLLHERKSRRSQSSTSDAGSTEDWNDVAAHLSKHWQELGANIAQLASIHFDLWRLRSAGWVPTFVWSFVAALATATTVICAAGYGVRGLAEGLGELYGGRRWAGDLTAAGVLLGLVSTGVYFGCRRWSVFQQQKIREHHALRNQAPQSESGDGCGEANID